MAFKFAIAGLALGVVGAKAQTTDDSNFYSLTDDYFATRTSTKSSMFWTVTQRYVDWVSLEPYTYAGQTTTYDYTSTRTIKASVTPTVSPTYSTSYRSAYDDVEVHGLYYPTGAVAESDLVSQYDYRDYYFSTATATATTKSTFSTTAYYMAVTMTAPASCPTVFTVATQASISYIPAIVTDQLQPASTSVSTSEGRYSVYEWATWYLTDGAAPFTSSSDDNYYYYIKSCTPPPASATSSSRTSGDSGSSSRYGSGSSDNDDSWMDYRACYLGGCTSLKTWIIIIATVLPGIFLLGFLESWFWYTRLMKGKSAMRCGTICWILLSLWVLCFTRMQDARSKEDQALLQQNWKEMPAGKKFRNWSWGFKRRYPVPLLGQFSKQTVGIVPEGQPLHPAMAQGPAGQVFYYGPPPGAPGFQQGGQGAPGYPMPPQGYPQQGYYATNVPKEGVVVGSAPVPGTATPPQAPQPAYQPSTSPPNAQVPPPPQQQKPVPAPPANVNEAPAEQTREAPAEQTREAPTSQAPQLPPISTAEAPEATSAPVTTESQPTHAVPAKNDTNDDLYK